MAIPRISHGLLRSAARAPASRTSALRPGAQQVRTQVRGKDDLGGPGGQQPPPKSPGGPEIVKRNWVPIAGGAAAVLAAYAYFSGGKPKKEDVQAALRDAQNQGKEALKSGGQEMAGRKGDKGSFRGD